MSASDLETALHDKLVANDTIRDQVGEHIYAGRLPQGVTATRYIVLSDFDSQPEYHVGGDTGVSTSTVQIDLWAHDPGGFGVLKKDDPTSVGEQLKATLSGQRFTEGSIHVKSCTIVRDDTVSERPIDGSDNWRRRRSFDFRIIHSLAS